MNEVKAYTDLEQSKKLAEILPIETADMWYEDSGIMIPRLGHIPKDYTDTEFPCWTLAALLSVLNCPELTQVSNGGWFIRTWYLYQPYTISGVNPVDICYELIIRLHDLKLL